MKHNILLVDDREENLFSLQNMLEMEGRNFLLATSGNDALRIAFKEDISLILLDVQMPEMDGFETAELLHGNKKTKNIPIVFVTAISKDTKYILRGLEEGAIDYLFKPLDVDITRAKVQTLLQFVGLRKELEEKNKELAKLNDEKNKLLGIAAHDLRNPLGNIMLLSQFLIDEIGEIIPEENKEFMVMIQNSSEYMLGLINNLLDVSKIESGNLKLNLTKEDINKVIKTVVQLNQRTLDKKGITLDFVSDTSQIMLDIDKLQMEQVLNNLLSNAIKFSYPDSKISILLDGSNDENISISVTDQGQGIPENEIDKLFKFFSRTSVQSTAGEHSTGLGLAITKKIVDAHGGNITVQSRPGEGSTFTVQLPRN